MRPHVPNTREREREMQKLPIGFSLRVDVDAWKPESNFFTFLIENQDHSILNLNNTNQEDTPFTLEFNPKGNNK